MLAYCTAADLPSGLLIYAAGEDEPAEYRINHAGKAIEVVALDLSGTPENILGKVDRLAERVRDHARFALGQGGRITRSAGPVLVGRSRQSYRAKKERE